MSISLCVCLLTVAHLTSIYTVLDRARDKIFLDIRQTFSVWFIPRYHAHVRLVTVLDLVACDPSRHEDGEPLAIKQDSEYDNGNNNDDNEYDDDDNKNSGEKPAARRRRRPTLWRIARQEDLYQVNEFLKFVGPFWWCLWRVLWFPFQLAATAVCVFLSLFVALSPWAFQKDPAAGGVENTVEQVEVYYDYDDHAGRGKSGGGGSKGMGPVTPPRKHSTARKKSTR